MFPERIEEPKKWDLEDVAKLVNMFDFLKGKLKSFSLISKEAVKRGIINENEINSLYASFTRVNSRLGLFEGEFFPRDQTSTGLDRWEYRIPEKMTVEEFKNKILEYAKKNFKTPFKGDIFEIKRKKKTKKLTDDF